MRLKLHDRTGWRLREAAGLLVLESDPCLDSRVGGRFVDVVKLVNGLPTVRKTRFVRF